MRSACFLGTMARVVPLVRCPRDRNALFVRNAFSTSPAYRHFPVHLAQVFLALEQERFQVVRPKIGIVEVAFIESEKLEDCLDLRIVRKKRAIYVPWGMKPHG